VEVEQTGDGTVIQSPSRIAIAVRNGNQSALRDVLSPGLANVDSTHQGYTGLHLAILYGNVDAAILLIAHEADVNRTDTSGNSPLDLCALSNSLSDEDSSRLSR
jgi:ankyrin repeat protein